MKSLLFVSCLICFAIICNAQPKVGDTIPNIILPNAKGDTVNVLNLTGANYYIIDFWASWCGPCLREMPKLKKYYAENKKKGIEIISIALDEDTADWQKTLRKLKTSWINLHSAGDWDSPIAVAWEIEQLPTMYLINGQGVVLAKGINLDSLKKKIKK